MQKRNNKEDFMIDLRRDDFKIMFMGKEIDLSFADEMIINKKKDHFDKITVKIRSDNKILKDEFQNIFFIHRNKKYRLLEVSNEK